MDDMDDKPNIKRIFVALTEGGLSGKYTEDTCGIDLSEAFFQFIIEEEFDDEQIPEEFGDGAEEESFFMDWLVSNKEIQESSAKNMWRDLNLAIKGKYDGKAEQTADNGIIDEGVGFAEIFKKYNIKVKDADLQFIKEQLLKYCPDLMPAGGGCNVDKELDKATYAVIAIGKQNRNQPLLMYLNDAFNRYRIQKRKRLILKLKRQQYTGKEFEVAFNQSFQELAIEPAQFVKEKCKGIVSWLSDYTQSQQRKFLEMCQAAITVFPRRLLHNVPMKARMAFVDDDIVQISEYILQCYTFIEEFVQQKNSQTMPAQIDVIIIPRKYKLINWDDEDEDDIDDAKNSDDEQDTFCEEKTNSVVNIGDISKRLSKIKNKMDCMDISLGTANRTMLQAINTIFAGKRNQRGILVIDRRYGGGKATDKCYAFQLNDKGKCFEANQRKLLNESLIQNLRISTLPKLNEKQDININTQKPFGLTFSFQCFSANEIRVYLCNNGWGTRFFVEDIKYFLPVFFVKREKEKIELAFTGEKNRDFEDKYAKCKSKCQDTKFEIFYKSLFNDDKRKCH